MIKEIICEAKRAKFIIYTNPNNSTGNNAYVAVGAYDVNKIVRDAKEYPGSCAILYQGQGTNDDLQKAKAMFHDYRFNSKVTIDESILTEGRIYPERCEVEHTYLVGYRRHEFEAKFKGWVSRADKTPRMKWADKDGTTWEAYMFNGVMSVGTSADPLMIFKEIN